MEVGGWVGGWVQVSLGIFFGKSSQNSPKPVLIFWSSTVTMCILYVYILLTVFGFYDLSILSMSMMGFQKSLDGGWVGEVSSIQVYFGFLEFFKLCKAPYLSFLYLHSFPDRT